MIDTRDGAHRVVEHPRNEQQLLERSDMYDQSHRRSSDTCVGHCALQSVNRAAGELSFDIRSKLRNVRTRDAGRLSHRMAVAIVAFRNGG